MLNRFGMTFVAVVRALMRPPRFGSYWASLEPHRARWIGLAVLLAVAAGILMATADVPAIVAARNLNRNWVVNAFDLYTDTGKSGWVLWPLGLFTLALIALLSMDLARATRRLMMPILVRAGFLFLAVGVPGLFATIVKRMIGRARPFVGGAPDAFNYSPMAFHVHYASLPSGHATTAFALAVAVAALWPRTRWVMAIYAVLVAISRVMVTAHHPSDVVMGALVGILGALFVRHWFALRGFAFAMRADGTISPKPGPRWRHFRALWTHMTVDWRARRAHGAAE